MSHSTQICKVDQTARGKKNNSEYYYGDATPMLQGFTKTGGKKKLVNNNDVTSEYCTKVPVDKTKGPVTTKMLVLAKHKGNWRGWRLGWGWGGRIGRGLCCLLWRR